MSNCIAWMLLIMACIINLEHPSPDQGITILCATAILLHLENLGEKGGPK